MTAAFLPGEKMDHLKTKSTRQCKVVDLFNEAAPGELKSKYFRGTFVTLLL